MMVAPRVYPKIPEPDAVYYGPLQHRTNISLKAQFTGQIVIKAMLGGATLATYTVPANSTNYVIKIPLDDGKPPRIPNRAKAGDLIRLYICNPGANIQVEVGSGFTISSDRGPVNSATLSVNVDALADADMDGIPNAWEAMFGLNPNSPNSGDTDGDGMSDLCEWIANTNPNDINSSFGIWSQAIVTNQMTLIFGPTFTGRLYRIEGSSNMSTWIEFDIYDPAINRPLVTNLYDVLTIPQPFIRSKVNLK